MSGHEGGSSERDAIEAAEEKIRLAEKHLDEARQLENRARKEMDEALQDLKRAENENDASEGHRTFVFFVSEVEYKTDQAALTGLQIKAKVPDWDPTHDLVLEGHGNDPDQVIRDDEPVSFKQAKHTLKFSSAPKANFG